MRFRFGVMVWNVWKITVIATDAVKVPPVALAYLMSLNGQTVGGQGKVFAVTE